MIIKYLIFHKIMTLSMVLWLTSHIGNYILSEQILLPLQLDTVFSSSSYYGRILNWTAADLNPVPGWGGP